MQLLHPRTSPRPRVAPIGGDDDQSIIQSTQGGEATADVREARATSIGMLITNHILQDGELVLLVLKPSVWFVLLSSLWTIGFVLVGLLAALIFDEQIPGRAARWIELAVFLMAGRVMWAVLQWMGRLYVLTDMRILRLSGVFNVNIFDCPLRKVARTRVVRSMRERLLRLGSIEITPCDGDCAPGMWNTVARPDVVNEQINAAINRAKSGRGNPVRLG
jgi:hypothetical protein